MTTVTQIDVNMTLAALAAAENALREQPYDRQPCLAGSLAMAAHRIRAMQAELELLRQQNDAVKCSCHERDSSYVCEYCYARCERGHMQR